MQQLRNSGDNWPSSGSACGRIVLSATIETALSGIERAWLPFLDQAFGYLILGRGFEERCCSSEAKIGNALARFGRLVGEESEDGELSHRR